MVSQYANTIQFGSLTLSVDRLTAVKVPHTSKQVIGTSLRQREIPGTTLQDWSIIIEGRHVDANRHTDRETLEGYDDLTTHTLTDGIHDGEYFIVRLEYNDVSNKPTSYSFRLVLIQDQ